VHLVRFDRELEQADLSVDELMHLVLLAATRRPNSTKNHHAPKAAAQF